MSLRKKASITNEYNKNEKKSIPDTVRIEVFIIISLFILIVTPFAIRVIVKINTNITRVNLQVSPEFEQILGAEITGNLLLEFGEQNPDMSIKLQDDFNKEPDIVIFDENNLGKYKSFFMDGNVLPLVSFMDILFYNIDILSKAGFDRPPKTKNEYLAYAKKVSEEGIYSDELDELKKIANNKRLEDFMQGRAAMIVTSTRAIPLLREKMGDEAFGITSVPDGDDGSSGRYDINLTGIYTAINPACEHPEAAQIFIDFLTEKIPVFCEMFKAVPGVVSDIFPGDYIKDDLFYSKAWDIFEYNRLIGPAESE